MEELSSWLQEHSIEYVRTDFGIMCSRIKPDGFDVGIEISEIVKTVYFDGWHQHFDEINEAISCFQAGLTDEVRLIEYQRGETPYKWRLEVLIDGQWEHHSTTGLLFFPIWKRHTERTLQNDYATRS